MVRVFTLSEFSLYTYINRRLSHRKYQTRLSYFSSHNYPHINIIASVVEESRRMATTVTPASVLPAQQEQKATIETPPRAPSPVHRFGTRAVHTGAPIEPTTGAVIAPVRPPDALSSLPVRVADRPDRSPCRPPSYSTAWASPSATTSTPAAPTPTGPLTLQMHPIEPSSAA